MEQQGEEVTFENTVGIDRVLLERKYPCLFQLLNRGVYVYYWDYTLYNPNKLFGLLGINLNPRLGTRAQMRWQVSFRVPIRSTS